MRSKKKNPVGANGIRSIHPGFDRSVLCGGIMSDRIFGELVNALANRVNAINTYGISCYSKTQSTIDRSSPHSDNVAQNNLSHVRPRSRSTSETFGDPVTVTATSDSACSSQRRLVSECCVSLRYNLGFLLINVAVAGWLC